MLFVITDGGLINKSFINSPRFYISKMTGGKDYNFETLLDQLNGVKLDLPILGCNNFDKGLNLETIFREDLFYTPSHPAYDARVITGDSDSSSIENALEQFNFGKPITIDSKTFFEPFRKQSHRDADLTQFDLDCDSGVGRSQRMELQARGRWYDAPYSFVLRYEWNPVATLSFKAQEGAILISQIQGIKSSQEALRPLKWARSLIEVACLWAKQNGIEEVRVLPHYRCQSPTAREHGKMNYDVPAKRNGFKLDPVLDLYVKKVC